MAASTAMACQDDGQRDAAVDAALRAQERRQAGARRTAWIIAAIAFAFFIASLVQGHFAHIPH